MGQFGGHDERQRARHTAATAGMAARTANAGRGHRDSRPLLADGRMRRLIGESRGAAQLENHCLPGTDLTGARVLPLHAGPQRVEIPRPKHQQQRSGHAGAAQGQPAGTRGQQLTGRRGRKSLPARAPQWCSGEPRRVATNPEQTGGFRTLHAFPRGVELARPQSHAREFPGSSALWFRSSGHTEPRGGCVGFVWAADQHCDRPVSAPPALGECSGSVGLLAALRGRRPVGPHDPQAAGPSVLDADARLQHDRPGPAGGGMRRQFTPLIHRFRRVLACGNVNDQPGGRLFALHALARRVRFS